jgi:replicative DNA helicase
MTALRLPDEERKLLGTMFVGAIPVDALADVLRPEDFSTDDHAHLWRDALQWFREDPSLGVETLLSLAIQGADDYGGAAYVSSLGDRALSSHVDMLGLARQIRAAADRRRVIAACRSAITGLSDGKDIEESIAAVELAVQGSAHQSEERDRVWSEVLTRSTSQVVTRHEDVASGRLVSLPMPMHRFANQFVMEPGELVILAARPGMGKSSMAMQLVECCEESGLPTCTIMLEMTELQTVSRLAATRASRAISARDATQGRLQRDDLSTFVDTAAAMGSWRGELWDDSGITVEQLGRRARASKRRNPDLSLVVVDHIGKLAASQPRMSDYERTSHASSYLKNLAKELGVVVVALCQLNRQVESRTDKRPRLSDLRDSGKLEEDADSILMLYRGDYYEDPNAQPGVAEVIVAKQRQGESPLSHPMRWVAERFRFEEFERPWAIGRGA